MSKVTGMGTNEQGMFAVNTSRANRVERKTENRKGSVIFAGDLNMGQDSILARKKKAQKEAMKIISDVFESDLKTGEEQKNRLQHIEELKKDNLDARSQLKDIEDMQNNLIDEYGVTEDSQERQDLELIRKVRNGTNPFAEKDLTEEEIKRYAEIEKQGLTEYQEKALALDEDAKDINARMTDNKREIGREEAAYHDTKMECLKKNPMAGAKEQAEEILEAARKEMIGALYNESKEHLDEKAEDAKEVQKEKNEEKKEKEKEEAVREIKKIEREILLQNAQEKIVEQTAKEKARNQASLQNRINEYVLSEIKEGTDKSVETEQEIKDLLEKMRLLQEDIKGAAVDDTV